mgnify:CR=1 FL=1
MVAVDDVGRRAAISQHEAAQGSVWVKNKVEAADARSWAAISKLAVAQGSDKQMEAVEDVRRGATRRQQ